MQRLILSKYAPCVFLYGPYIYVQYRNFVRRIEVGTDQAANFSYRVWLDR